MSTADQLSNIISESITGGIYVAYTALALVPFVGWRSWKLFHWVTRFRLTPDRVRFDGSPMGERARITARVPIYMLMWLLVIFCFGRLIGVLCLSLPDFIFNDDNTLGVLKAFTMSAVNTTNAIQYYILTLIVVIWMRACAPFVNSSVDDVWYKRPLFIVRWFVALPLLALANAVAAVAYVSAYIFFFIGAHPDYGFMFIIKWANQMYNPLFRAADGLMLVAQLIIGVCLGALFITGIREKRAQSRRSTSKANRKIYDDAIFRFQVVFAKLSIAIVLLFILFAYRIIGILLMSGQLPFWLYSLVSRFLVESIMIFVCVVFFWPYKIPFANKLRVFRPIELVNSLVASGAGGAAGDKAAGTKATVLGGAGAGGSAPLHEIPVETARGDDTSSSEEGDEADESAAQV